MKRNITTALALIALTLLVAGCSSVTPAMYAQEKPVLDLYRYFDGTVDGWGQFTDRSGRVVRRFVVEVRGTVAGERLTLEEDFRYSDGSVSKRTWNVVRTGPATFTGTAGDVVGTARGEAAGNALRWTYVLALEVDGRTYHVDFDDWMYLQDGTVMLNNSRMSKFGIGLGELTLAFRKRP